MTRDKNGLEKISKKFKQNEKKDLKTSISQQEEEQAKLNLVIFQALPQNQQKVCGSALEEELEEGNSKSK